MPQEMPCLVRIQLLLLPLVLGVAAVPVVHVVAPAPAAPAAPAAPSWPSGGAAPVQVVTLHEALCPDCVAQDWVLYGAKKDLASILNMTTLWWGNAKLRPGAEEIICQHGPVECEANQFLNCLQAYHPNLHDEFVHCFDWSLIFGCPGGCPAPPPLPLYNKIMQNCSSSLGLDYSAMQKCATNDAGVDLVMRARAATAPYKHTYVPWLVINGVHNPTAEKSASNFVAEVCKAYGDQADLPPACTGADAAVQASPGDMAARPEGAGTKGSPVFRV